MVKKSPKKLLKSRPESRQNLDGSLETQETENPVFVGVNTTCVTDFVAAEPVPAAVTSSLVLVTTEDQPLKDFDRLLTGKTLDKIADIPEIDQLLEETEARIVNAASAIDQILIEQETQDQPSSESNPDDLLTKAVEKTQTNKKKSKTSPEKRTGGTNQIIADLKSKQKTSPLTETPTMAETFQSSETATVHPLQNFQLIILATLGLGLLVFGLFQFIKNVNQNFASEIPIAPVTNEQSPPHILSFQGRLSATERIISPTPMEFSLYDTSGGNVPPPTGGNQIWTSGTCLVTVDPQGYFAVSLGAGQGNDHDGDACGADLGDTFAQHSNLWLQIRVRSEVLFPRQLVKAVPYALNSDTLDGYHASSSATANTVPVINAEGNLVINTSGSAIINSGDLSLRSTDGNLYFLPGGGKVQVEGNLTVVGQLAADNLSLVGRNKQATIEALGSDLTLRTSASRDLSTQAVLTLTQRGKVGIGTTNPGQKLSIAQGNLGFDFLKAPNSQDFIATEDAVTQNGLRGLAVPAAPLKFELLPEDGGELTPGNYNYSVSFVTFDGTRYRETLPGAVTSVAIAAPRTSVLLSNIPTYPADNVVARRVYRTKVGGTTPYLVAVISDNLTTSLIDTSSDASLATLAPATNDANTYRYKVTYVSSTGETNASDATPIVSLSGNGRAVKLDHIPTDPSETATARNIYRTLAGGETYYLVATIPDNSTHTLYDTLPDSSLLSHRLLADYNTTSGGLYAGDQKLIQLSDDGKIVTDGQLIASGRLETSHGDNQGLKLPTSVGKPVVRIGQKPGDIVFDTVSSTIYIYDGRDFVAQGSVANDEIVATPTPPAAGQSGSACLGNSCQVRIEPEYTGAVITTDGENHHGNLTADHEIIDGKLHYNYYLWQSSTAVIPQNVDILLSLTLPNDFSGWENNAITLDYATRTINAAENHVNVTVFKNGGDSVSQTEIVASTPDTWMSNANSTQPLTISSSQLAALDLKAGDTLIVQITPNSENNNFVKLGALTLHYLGNQGVTVADGKSYWHKLAGALFTDTDTESIFFGGTNLDDAKIAMLGLKGEDSATLAVGGNIFLNGPQDSYLDIAASNRFAIRAGEALREALTILPDGSVGIGNANPQNALDVGGSASVSGALSLAPISASEAGSCEPTTEGKIYYDIDQRNFFACTALDQNRSQFGWVALVRTTP